MELQITFFNQNELKEQSGELQKFIYSLQEEKLTFALQHHQLLQANLMSIVTNKEGRWLGLAGFRKQMGVYIFFLVVHRDIQNQGVGRRLTAAVLRKFPPWGLMLLTVTRSNLSARKLYDSFGFKVIHKSRSNVIMGFGNLPFILMRPVLTIWVKIKNRGQ